MNQISQLKQGDFMALMYKILLNKNKHTNARRVATAYGKICNLPYAFDPEIYCMSKDSQKPVITEPKEVRKLLIKMADSIIACNLVYGINTDEDRVVVSYMPDLKWAIVSFTSYSAPNDETEGYMDDLKAAFNAQ